MTRQDNNSSRKPGHTSRIQQLEKKSLIAFAEINSSQSETALCSAVLAQSDTDAMVPLVHWPVPGHHRLDSPSESAGCLAARKKNKNALRNSSGSLLQRCDLHDTFAVHLPTVFS